MMSAVASVGSARPVLWRRCPALPCFPCATKDNIQFVSLRMASSSSSSSSGGGKGGSGGGGPTTVERRECDADCGRSMDDVVDDPNRAVASHERPPPAPPPPRWYELPPLTRMGWLHINGGVALVTFLCPALSNYALFRLALGLAVSLGSVGSSTGPSGGGGRLCPAAPARCWQLRAS